jgi:O-6-methylguanine DNA methyltransferase
MRFVEHAPPDAIVSVGELDFAVWLSDRGVRRIELPALNGKQGTRYSGESVRIDIYEESAHGSMEYLEALGSFLSSTLRGVESAARPPVDLRGLTPFTGEVLEAVSEIPRGESRSYAWVARSVGRPAASRAVGGAVGRNPVPLLVPCHRVVRTDGSIGGWSGAPGWKEWLLENEST